MLHMYPYLVCATSFKFTLDKCYVSKSLQHFIMRHGFLAIFTVRVGIEKLAKSFVPADMCTYSTGIIFHISPNKGDILAVYGVIKKLPGEVCQRLACFGDHHQPTRVFVDAVHEAITR